MWPLLIATMAITLGSVRVKIKNIRRRKPVNEWMTGYKPHIRFMEKS